MSKHDDDTCPHLVRASLLETENARLKAEVERLTKELKDEKSANTNVEGRMQSANRCLSMANHTLKAEVERLRASSFVTAVPVEQYQRVVKAGDAMSEELIGRYFGNRLVTDWNAAKEGKPSV